MAETESKNQTHGCQAVRASQKFRARESALETGKALRAARAKPAATPQKRLVTGRLPLALKEIYLKFLEDFL